VGRTVGERGSEENGSHGRKRGSSRFRFKGENCLEGEKAVLEEGIHLGIGMVKKHPALEGKKAGSRAKDWKREKDPTGGGAGGYRGEKWKKKREKPEAKEDT